MTRKESRCIVVPSPSLVQTGADQRAPGVGTARPQKDSRGGIAMQCPAGSTETPAGATFCQHCGASLSAAPPPPPSGGFTQVPQPAAAPVGAGYVPAQSGLSDNAAAAIAY